MKFLDYLFHGKELRYIDSYFKMLNGYSPTFTSYNGGVYEMDLTRTAVNSFATHCSKLKPEIEGSALKSLEKTLQHKPNYFMDTTKFIKRLATYVAVEHTAFIIPIEDEYGRLCGWYPLRAQRCEVVEAAGQVYLRYLFANGEHGAIEFERVGIMTDFEYTDDLFGEDNSTLAPTMQLIHTQNEGISIFPPHSDNSTGRGLFGHHISFLDKSVNIVGRGFLINFQYGIGFNQVTEYLRVYFALFFVSQRMVFFQFFVIFQRHRSVYISILNRLVRK